MARLILVLIFLGVMVYAVIAVVGLAKSASTTANLALGDNMPKTFQRIAYVVLILLMLGVVTGWLGAA